MKKGSNKLKNPHHNECELQEVESQIKKDVKIAKDLVDGFYEDRDLIKIIFEGCVSGSENRVSIQVGIPEFDRYLEVGELLIKGCVDEEGKVINIYNGGMSMGSENIFWIIKHNYPSLLGKNKGLDSEIERIESELNFISWIEDSVHEIIAGKIQEIEDDGFRVVIN